MKVLGFALIVVGLAMIFIRGFYVPVKTNVVNIGPIEISKKEDKWIGWPTYAGGLMTVIGIVLVVTNKKR